MAESDKYLIGESLRQKLKSTIAKVDSIPFGGPVFRLPRGAVSDERTFVPKVFRVCTATGEWPVDTSKDVTFYGVESTPNTVSVLNKLVSLPAPSTATSRIVNVAKDGSEWYLVSFQMSSQTAVVATATQTITFIGAADTQTITFISAGGTQTLSYASAGEEKTLTYVSSVSEVDVIASVSATLNPDDCSINVSTTTSKIKTANDPQTTTFKTAGGSQTATIVSISSTQTAAILSVAGTQTATIMTGTYTATFISLEI
jgi:hypothetical protein